MVYFSQVIRSRLVEMAESVQGVHLRNLAMREDARKEVRFTRAQTERAGLKGVSFDEFQTNFGPSSAIDTLFILGSGSSVNELSSGQFQAIAEQNSVGINTWAVHPFIPNYYSLERVPWVGDGRDFERNLTYLGRVEVIKRNPGLVILRPKGISGLQALSEVPRELRSNVFLYGRVTPVTRNQANLQDDIRFFFERVATKFPGLVLDSGASVVRMVSLGISMGFKRIVLVGIDLNGSPYFWEDRPELLDGLRGNRPTNNQRHRVHETVGDSNRPFGVIVMLEKLAEFFQTSREGELLNASPNSALQGVLDSSLWNL